MRPYVGLCLHLRWPGAQVVCRLVGDVTAGGGQGSGLLVPSDERSGVLLNMLSCTGQTHNDGLSDPKFQLCQGGEILLQSMTVLICARKNPPQLRGFSENIQPGDLL